MTFLRRYSRFFYNYTSFSQSGFSSSIIKCNTKMSSSPSFTSVHDFILSQLNLFQKTGSLSGCFASLREKKAYRALNVCNINALTHVAFIRNINCPYHDYSFEFNILTLFSFTLYFFSTKRLSGRASRLLFGIPSRPTGPDIVLPFSSQIALHPPAGEITPLTQNARCVQ